MNFGLRVTGRRADGYHELESVFLPLDLADDVDVVLGEPGGGVELALEGADASLPAGPENLAARAAAAFLRAAGVERGVRLRLRKRIPAGAGLGGGSSDAGAVLRGLDALLPGAVPGPSLAGLALGLGADVPFFLDPRPAFVSGVGERCEPLAGPWPCFALLLANPGTPLATARVFAAYDALARPRGAPSLRPRVDALRAAPDAPEALEALLENDLEPAAVRLCPPIARLRRALRDAGARAVGLSGSGATLFAVFPDVEAAGAAREALPEGVWARVAKTAESG